MVLVWQIMDNSPNSSNFPQAKLTHSMVTVHGIVTPIHNGLNFCPLGPGSTDAISCQEHGNFSQCITEVDTGSVRVLLHVDSNDTEVAIYCTLFYKYRTLCLYEYNQELITLDITVYVKLLDFIGVLYSEYTAPLYAKYIIVTVLAIASTNMNHVHVQVHIFITTRFSSTYLVSHLPASQIA